MGVSIESSGKGRKGVDSELNLIPFIDLLSVCILFLLMTAVWVQISKMSAMTQPSGETLIAHSDVSSVNQTKEDRDFDILVTRETVEVKEDGKSLKIFALTDAGLELAKLEAQFKKTTDPKISLRAADDVIYEDVIAVLDALFSMKLAHISLGGL